MISDDLHALGFDFPQWHDLVDALMAAGAHAIEDVGPYRGVALYQDADGAGVALVGYESEPPFTVTSLKGTRGFKVQAYQIYPTMALLDIYDDDDEIMTRLLATVNDPHMYPIYQFGDPQKLAVYNDYRLSGVALDVTVYRTEEEWRSEQTPLDMSESVVPGIADSTYLGPEFIASPWLFALYSGTNKPEEANSATWFKGTISEVELKTNALTGQQWYRVEANCSFPIVLAIPGDIDPAPVPGGVIDGSVMLLGSTGFWDQD